MELRRSLQQPDTDTLFAVAPLHQCACLGDRWSKHPLGAKELCSLRALIFKDPTFGRCPTSESLLSQAFSRHHFDCLIAETIIKTHLSGRCRSSRYKLHLPYLQRIADRRRRRRTTRSRIATKKVMASTASHTETYPHDHHLKNTSGRSQRNRTKV